MGRAKLALKRISNESDRKLAFKRRKKGIMKKMAEFSTMCGVDACLIIYDGNGDAQPVTWPENSRKVHSIVEKYELTKNEKPHKNFDLENFFENKKKTVESEISKVQKDIVKIKYPTWHPSFNGLEEEQLSNFIAMLDTKVEACKKRINMLKNKHQSEANMSSMQNMAQSESAASDSSQPNFTHNITQSQDSIIPMKPINDEYQLASYLPELDKDSQSQMLNFDSNLMQLMAMKTNQVNVPLGCTNQVGAFGNSRNELDVPVDWTSQLGQPLDWVSQLGEVEAWTSELGGLVDTGSPRESINWTNQLGGFGNSTNQIDGPVD
ncbi:agamous-like MADS-box protein AGL82 [Gastrolobium bilobum]|uniref:agamous-like MADS-box protein AGL82 n=1 Tax=Gastrolobium bilobum TaxID=150636 RepID=UPI002AB25DFA|nr:agamous-like MADS-box protein AGL82 [Gastrolobium bilobum]